MSEWVEEDLLNDMIEDHLAFSKTMGEVSDACIFSVGIADSGLYVSISDCMFKGEDSHEQYSKYSNDITSKSVVSLEMRNLKVSTNMLSVAMLIEGNMHKVSYYSFKGDWEVKKSPSFVFTDKESHDRWVNDKIEKLKKDKIEEMKEAIKSIFDGEVQIREIDPKDLPDDLKKMMNKEKKKPGGRFDFFKN